MSLDSDREYVKSIINDRVSIFGPDVKFSALVELLREEFDKIDVDKQRLHALIVSDMAGEFSAKAIGRK